ncbi:DNA replication protein [Xenorhabdus bovienii]|uniref:DNA replication protein n=1 Tax=Xenorhabdus bovienii TaxID=40576 RepID=A0AAJ1JHH0_XENBV|nr:replication protein P [Xenorhabdus bovienii]MDE1480573.1 DNA replication protein [Xenorhabdus bovienii]MDE1488586.1 DNA replication protein [Xenorhabdus bovienii]MDE1493246.1 DNA replication protein [Xenorhabdus bovienii]MDE9512282.1 DNA replication protein [Xenorhabdus bovienii]MDE9523925.1 DNA replication protein [Xenorhabdus bovienii]
MTLAKVIQDRDGAALAKMAGSVKSPDKVVNDEAERLVDVLFKNLKSVFPAAISTIFKDPSDEVAAKRQWIAAFAENGIRTKEQLSAGMRYARASENPFWPSPGQFVQWCKQGEAIAMGLPTEEDLYGMFRDYCNHRDWRDIEWQSNACYWMVTKIYSDMIRQNLTDSEVRKLCVRELRAMTKRIQAGEKIPEPVVQIEKKHTPTDHYRALENIKDLKKMLAKDIQEDVWWYQHKRGIK